MKNNKAPDEEVTVDMIKAIGIQGICRIMR
jgi:hypothetical protein